ncbi:glycosyltransferase [Virgibacillus kekensis]|uniref:Glycosyltransferase n=1 Tax=Virgibacillus kekensis TaxID=202261 RepID=A0ABV9DGY5_9BACI
MRNKTLFISNMYPGKKNPSFGVFVKNQIDLLNAKGVKGDNIVISDDKSGKFNVLKKYGVWFAKSLYSLLFNYKKYNLVHAHYVFPSGLIALLFKKVRNIPYVVTAHGGDIDRMPYKNKVIFMITEKILKEADAVIAVGEKLKEDIVKNFHIDSNNIYVLNMGVNRDVFIPFDQDQMRKQLGLATDTKRLLFVGNIIRAKGIDELIKAFANLKKSFDDLQLDIIGAQKDPQYIQEVHNLIERLDVEDISIHPPKGQKEIASWMAAADAFILPSHIEGFGLVALEALSTNTPVVGSDVGGLSYLLRNDVGILVEPKSEDSLKEGIKKILESDKIKTMLIKNGENKAEEFDQEVIIQSIVNIYKNIEERHYE